jgi:hypothetical protein
MEDLLRSKGLYQNNLGNEKEPTNVNNKLKWDNRSEKSCGLIRISISLGLRFHLKEIDDPDEAWECIW